MLAAGGVAAGGAAGVAGGVGATENAGGTEAVWGVVSDGDTFDGEAMPVSSSSPLPLSVLWSFHMCVLREGL